jgi:hypothetical protein
MTRALAILSLLPLVACGSKQIATASPPPDAEDLDVAVEVIAKDADDETAAPHADAAAPHADAAAPHADAAAFYTCGPDSNGSQPPARNPACTGPIADDPKGCDTGWTGFEHQGKTYTCNNCPKGDPVAQGLWRFIDFETEDPSTPLGGYAELLAVDGNTWHLHMKGEDLGKPADVRVDGWYMCTDAAELKSKNKIFRTVTVSPPGGFAWTAGTVFTGQFLVKGSDLLAFALYKGFERDWIGDALYCRVGSTIAGKPCPNPFD